MLLLETCSVPVAWRGGVVHRLPRALVRDPGVRLLPWLHPQVQCPTAAPSSLHSAIASRLHGHLRGLPGDRA